MNRILKFVLIDILKNKIVLVYTLLLGVLSWSAFGLEDNSTKGLLTLLNIVLLTVPLVAILFSTIYIYNSAEFIELLLSQPLRRSRIWSSLFFGLTVSLSLAFLLGCGIPLMIYQPGAAGWMMLILGLIITAVFVAIAFWCAIRTKDKAKGIGLAILVWLYFALLFDGIVLFLLFQLSDYPIEKAMVALTALSPVDLARILILLHLDVSAMLGYTGAIFKDFFGSTLGLWITFLLLLLWVVVPFLFSLKKFIRKDL